MIIINKIFKKFLLVSLLIFSLFLISGCEKEPDQPFDEFIDDIFIEMISSDPMNVNFFLKNPSLLGLENLEVKPVEISYQSHMDMINNMANLKNTLTRYKYANLSQEQKLTYDILLDYINQVIDYKDFYYYDTPLGSYLGYQAQLPFILAEYHFYTKKDITDYFAYLTTTQKSFENIIAFEKEKSEKGFGMNDIILNKIIEQCDNLVNEEENFLIGVFEEKVNSLSFLTNEEKIEFINQNKTYVNVNFVGAYRYLSSELKKLINTGKNYQGLYHFSAGKDYYQLLLEDATGTKMKAADALYYLQDILDEEFEELYDLSKLYPNLWEIISSDSFIAASTHQQTLDFFLEKYPNDFPAIGTINVQFKNIYEALEENSSPAMYFLSPIDASVTEVIYVNQKMFAENPAYAFFTLSHEAVPGHLLQHVVLKNSNLPNLRKYLDYSSYSEGWATYVEEYVGKYLTINSDHLKAYGINNRITYVILCIADIRINYYGWTLNQFSDYIKDYFGEDMETEVIEDMYYQLIEEPANYLEYFFSYYQIIDLKKEFISKAANKNYPNTDYHFHKFFLETGPAPFYILKKQIDNYLKAN